MHTFTDMLQILLWWTRIRKNVNISKFLTHALLKIYESFLSVNISAFLGRLLRRKHERETKLKIFLSRARVCSRKGAASCILMTRRQGCVYFRWYFPCEAVTTPIAFLYYLPANSETFESAVVPVTVGPGNNDQGYPKSSALRNC